MKNIDEWLRDVTNNKVFKIEKIIRIFTPYETDGKFIDQERYEDLGTYKIIEAIELPTQEVFLGVKSCFMDCKVINHEYVYSEVVNSNIEYFNLNDINIVDVTKIYLSDGHDKDETDDECEDFDD